MDSMMLQYQNPQEKLVDPLAMNTIGLLNANDNNHNNHNNNSNFLNGPSPQVMLDNTIARDARKILNYKKSFYDDAMFYPDACTSMHQMNGFAASSINNSNNTNNNMQNHANLLNNILMNKQLQMSQSVERNNDNNGTNSNKLLSILANKSLERQQFQFQQQHQHQQSRRVNSNSGNHNNNSHNNITSNNNNVYSNYRSQQGDPYLMN